MQPIDLTTEPIPSTAVVPFWSIENGLLKCIFRTTSNTVDYVLQLCPGQYGDQNVLWIGAVLGDGCVPGGFDVVPVCTSPAA